MHLPAIPLLGRQPERRAVDGLLAAMRDGRSGALVLTGEPGIGKTRLLEYAAAQANDLRVVLLAGVESETRLGFSGLHRLLRPFLSGLSRLPGPQREALESAFGLVAGLPADRYLAGLATLTLLADVAADRPMLCLVDDVHWLDRETAEVLTFTARRLHAESLGLMMAARDGNGDRTMFEGLSVLRLAGLPDVEAGKLLALRAGRHLDVSVAKRIVAGAGGNPLALIELAARLTAEQLAGIAPLPARLPAGRLIETYFRASVAALPPDTRTLLVLIAAAPADDEALIWRAAGRLGLAAREAEPAIEAGILDREHNATFRHPLIRSVVYAGAERGPRRQVHAALAEAADPVSDQDRTAWHRAEAAARPNEKVAADLEAAAVRARRRGGYSEEALFLSRAAELTPVPGKRAERLTAAAYAHILSGNLRSAEIGLETAAPDLDGPVPRARATRIKAMTEMFRIHGADVPAILLPAVAELGDLDPQLSWDMLSEAMFAGLMSIDGLRGTTLPEVAKVTAAAWHDPAAPAWSPDLLIKGLAERVTEGHGQAAPVLRAGLARLRSATFFRESSTPLAMLIGLATEELWDIEARRDLAARLAVADRAQGALYALSITLLVIAQSELIAGRFAEAEACYAQADDFAAATGLRTSGALNRMLLLAWTGREAELRAAVSESDALAASLGVEYLSRIGHHALCVLELGRGQYHPALERALPLFHADPVSIGSQVLPLVVEAGARAGDHASAAAALARLTERAGAAGTPWALGLLARCRALMSDDDRAPDLYRESAELLGQVPVTLDLAWTRLLFGEWLRRRRRRGDARKELRKAYDAFAACGAVPFAERARAELRATGEHVRKRSAEAADDLTPQERHVAVLAASGATNAEIAARLYITVSTVEFHLSKVFRKLGLTSRRQLAAGLGQAGLPTVT